MPDRSPAQWRLPGRVVYVASHSYPYSSNGYAVRTHEVANALQQQGHEVLVINRPGRPWDIEGFPAGTEVRSEQVIDGVRYVFLPARSRAGSPRGQRLQEAEGILHEAFGIFRPGAVIAASNWENAEPAQRAARRLNMPFFYEQRGFWELSRAEWDAGYQTDEAFVRDRDRETRVARAARAVFTLNAAMRDELVRRGVPRGRILLAPNGVSEPAQPTGAISRESIGCTSRHLLGYVGSLSSYEGGEDLPRLLARLRGDGVDAGLMIVGSSAPKGLIGSQHHGAQEQALTDLARELGVADHVHFVPQVPQDQVGAYYRLADVIMMPRRRTPVTELVAPLKPYTAASYGVPVLMSDLAPLREIAEDIGGRIFPEGDIAAMARLVRQELDRGDRSGSPLSPDIAWSNRVAQISTQLNRAAEESPAPGLALSGGGRWHRDRFDARAIPQVALQGLLGDGTVAVLGPGNHLEGLRPVCLTRQNLLAVLATAEPGTFVIDWAGLQDSPGEWEGLWSIANMRLNRQVMDACRIALDRGWRLQVTGPVLRSRAPLYRTVSAVLEEVGAEAAGPGGGQ